MLSFLILLTTFFVLAPPVCAQESNVYLIKMFGCTYKPVERSQTGFRVRGVKGLVTALHGLADCEKITASSRRGLFLDQPLTIRKVDIDHDVALLSSPQLEAAGEGGLEVADTVALEPLQIVTVYGHPYGIASLETPLTLRKPTVKTLKDLVPPNTLSFLKDRKSPNHHINVLNLSGNLLPGHSGAPILDSRGRVVAVANGGLKEGFAGICWAIPFQDVEWDEVLTSLKALRLLDPTILFASDAIPPKLSDEIKTEFCEQLSTVVDASRIGFISIVGADCCQDGRFYSKEKLSVWGRGFVRPDDPDGPSVTFVILGGNNIFQVKSQYYDWASKVVTCFPSWKREESAADGYKYYIFREKDEGPSIEVSYNLEPSQKTGTLNLFLKVESPHTPSKRPTP